MNWPKIEKDVLLKDNWNLITSLELVSSLYFDFLKFQEYNQIIIYSLFTTCSYNDHYTMSVISLWKFNNVYSLALAV